MVRYADDFIILARSKHVIMNYIKPAVENFLNVRGLTLSLEKTKILPMKNNKIKFKTANDFSIDDIILVSF